MNYFLIFLDSQSASSSSMSSQLNEGIQAIYSYIERDIGNTCIINCMNSYN